MHIFHTTSNFKRPNISRNTRWNYNFPLPFKNLPLKLHVIQTPLQKLGRKSLYQVLNISYFSHYTANISCQQCMVNEAALTWKTCTFGLTKKLPCTDSFIWGLVIKYGGGGPAKSVSLETVFC